MPELVVLELKRIFFLRNKLDRTSINNSLVIVDSVFLQRGWLVDLFRFLSVLHLYYSNMGFLRAPVIHVTRGYTLCFIRLFRKTEVLIRFINYTNEFFTWSRKKLCSCQISFSFHLSQIYFKGLFVLFKPFYLFQQFGFFFLKFLDKTLKAIFVNLLGDLQLFSQTMLGHQPKNQQWWQWLRTVAPSAATDRGPECYIRRTRQCMLGQMEAAQVPGGPILC